MKVTKLDGLNHVFTRMGGKELERLRLPVADIVLALVRKGEEQVAEKLAEAYNEAIGKLDTEAATTPHTLRTALIQMAETGSLATFSQTIKFYDLVERIADETADGADSVLLSPGEFDLLDSGVRHILDSSPGVSGAVKKNIARLLAAATEVDAEEK